jgi:hypothetical protein
VGGGDGLASLLLFSLLFSVLLLVAQFLVLAACSMSADEIMNTQKNGSKGKGIVENPQRYVLTKQFKLDFIYTNS